MHINMWDLYFSSHTVQSKNTAEPTENGDNSVLSDQCQGTVLTPRYKAFYTVLIISDRCSVLFVCLYLKGNVLTTAWPMTPVAVSKVTNSNQMGRTARVRKRFIQVVNLCLRVKHIQGISALKHSQTSTSVCWVPATVGEESAASTPRARSAVRERSAVALATNSLTTTTAKVCFCCSDLFFSYLWCDWRITMSLWPLHADIDECEAGIHNCNPEFECQNTQGSFRCLPKVKCGPGFIQDALGSCIGKHCSTSQGVHRVLKSLKSHDLMRVKRVT